MYYIGIDLGTSSVKLLLVSKSGEIINEVSKDYPVFYPHSGWSEQNPEDWWSRTVEGIKELIKVKISSFFIPILAQKHLLFRLNGL